MWRLAWTTEEDGISSPPSWPCASGPLCFPCFNHALHSACSTRANFCIPAYNNLLFFPVSKALWCILLFETCVMRIRQAVLDGISDIVLFTDCHVLCLFNIQQRFISFKARLSRNVFHTIALKGGKERETWQNFVESGIWFHSIYKLINEPLTVS